MLKIILIVGGVIIIIIISMLLIGYHQLYIDKTVFDYTRISYKKFKEVHKLDPDSWDIDTFMNFIEYKPKNKVFRLGFFGYIMIDRYMDKIDKKKGDKFIDEIKEELIAKKKGNKQ